MSIQNDYEWIVGFSGHRPDKLGNEYDMLGPYSYYVGKNIHEYLEGCMHNSYIKKITKIISGMALGVDTIAAVEALYLGIPVIAAIPFEGQEKAWPEKCQRRYHQILSHPLVEKVYVSGPGYASWKMQKRNEWVVDNCNMLYAIWDGSSGGTKNCIKYATQMKRMHHTINLPNKEKIEQIWKTI